MARNQETHVREERKRKKGDARVHVCPRIRPTAFLSLSLSLSPHVPRLFSHPLSRSSSLYPSLQGRSCLPLSLLLSRLSFPQSTAARRKETRRKSARVRRETVWQQEASEREREDERLEQNRGTSDRQMERKIESELRLLPHTGSIILAFCFYCCCFHLVILSGVTRVLLSRLLSFERSSCCSLQQSSEARSERLATAAIASLRQSGSV